MHRAFRVPLLLLALTLLCCLSPAADWPQWRGANRDGKSADTGLLKKWPREGLPLLWHAGNCGAGYGTPAIAAGKVFVLGTGTDNKDWLLCFDEQSGKQLWAWGMGRVRSTGGGYPGTRSTPAYVDGRLYIETLAGRVVCCDARNGQPIWWKEMSRDFGGKEPAFGYSESLLVDGDRVLCTPGGEKTVVALDAKTGNELWACKAGDQAAYSSIVRAAFSDVPQYVAFTARGLLGTRAADGAVLWRYDKPSNGQANIPTPLVVGETAFAASGYGRGGGCVLVRKDKDHPDAFTAKEIYSTNKMQNMHGGYVVIDNFLYGCCDPGVLVCLNYKTGMVSRALRTGRFSIAAADGMLYVRNEDGHMELYDASSVSLVRRGKFEQPYRSKLKAWTHPVIANGRLYLRDQFHLLCYNVTAPAPDPSKPDAGKPEAKPDVEKSAEKPAAEKPAGSAPVAKPVVTRT